MRPFPLRFASRALGRAFVVALALALLACGPAAEPPHASAPTGEWREFEGSWNAAGTRRTVPLGAERKGSIRDLRGTMLLAGQERPGLGFRAEVIALVDSETGLVGRSVWTDERASWKIITAFDIARTMAIGADWCNLARGFMFALGCIQAQACHTGFCPTGVTTQDPKRMRALHVPNKADRVYNFHENTLKALKELLGAAGLSHPSELGPEHVVRRVSSNEVRSLATLHPWIKPGELLAGVPDQPVFLVFWAASRSDSFAAPETMLAVRSSKSR